MFEKILHVSVLCKAGIFSSPPLLALPFNNTSSKAHFLPFLLSIFTIFAMQDPFTPPGKHILTLV